MMSSWKDLQEAIECGDVKGIKKYVADGLDVNRINQDGRSLLQLAAEKGQRDICLYLVSIGASLKTKNKDGVELLDWLKRSDSTLATELMTMSVSDDDVKRMRELRTTAPNSMAINDNTGMIQDGIGELSEQLSTGLANLGEALRASLLSADGNAEAPLERLTALESALCEHKKRILLHGDDAFMGSLVAEFYRVASEMGDQLAEKLKKSFSDVMNAATCGADGITPPPSQQDKISALLSMVSGLKSEVTIMNSSTKRFQDITGAQYQLMSAIEAPEIMPYTFVVLPKLKTGKIPRNGKMVDKMANCCKGLAGRVYNIFWGESRIVFICPVTLKPVRCGPSGDGYYLNIPTTSLNTLAPALSWGLAFLRMVLASQWLGGVIPQLNILPLGSADASDLQTMVETMSSELQGLTGSADFGIDLPSMAIGPRDPSNNHTQRAYKEVFQLIAKAEGYPGGVSDPVWKPTMTGLLLTVASQGKGKSMWVSAEGQQLYREHGSGALGGALPYGWISAVDPTTGRVFYANTTTGESQWERPEMKVVRKSPDDKVEPSVASVDNPIDSRPDDPMQGWVAVTDPTSGRVYYANTITQESQWDAPRIFYRVGSIVRIRDVSVSEAQSLQQGHGGLHEPMKVMLGKEGTLSSVDKTGGYMIVVNNRCFTWNPALIEYISEGGGPHKPSLGSGTHSHLYYCGRMIGKEYLLGSSDGRCGPTGGPQCLECLGYQTQNSNHLIGLPVLIRKVGEHYASTVQTEHGGFDRTMKSYLGREGTLGGIEPHGSFQVSIDGVTTRWNPCMLEVLIGQKYQRTRANKDCTYEYTYISTERHAKLQPAEVARVKAKNLKSAEDAIALLSLPSSNLDDVMLGLMTVWNFATVDLNNSQFSKPGNCEKIVSMLNMHVNSAEIVRYGTGALAALSTKKDNRAGIHSANGFGILINVMSVHKNNARIIENCCWALTSLSVDSALREQLGAIGACEAVVSALNTHGGDGKVIEAGWFAVGNLAANCAANQIKLGSLSVCELAVAALNNATKLRAIAEAALFTILGLIKHQLCIDKLVTAGVCDAILSALRTGNDDNNCIISHACSGISALCQRGETGKLLGSAGACETVLSALQKHMNDRDVARKGLAAVASLSVEDDNEIRLLSAGVCEIVVSVLRMHMDDRDVIPDGLQVLANISSSKANAMRLGSAGACETIMSALQMHMDDKDVARNGLAAVASLSIDDGNEKRFGSQGACEITVSALQMHMGDRDVVSACLRAVYNLNINSEYGTRLGYAGACEVVVSALKTHIGDKEVASGGLRAIVILSLIDENTTRLACAGACEATISALKAHMDGKVEAELGLRAVNNLSADSVKNRVKLGSVGACEIVTSALMEHMGDKGVAEYGLASVANLSLNNHDNATRFGSMGACEVVVSALRTHMDDQDVVTEGLRATAILSLIDENSARLAYAGACEATVSALKAHMEDEGVARWGVRVVMGISSGNAENKIRFGYAGTCETLVSLLQKHMDNKDMAENGARALVNLSAENADNTIRLGSAGACEVVVSALQMHMSDTDVVESNLGAIATLSYKNAEVSARLGSAGACEVVVPALAKHFSNVEVATGGLLAIANLATNNPNNSARLGSEGACEAVMFALNAYSKNDRVLMDAVDALRQLSSNNAKNRANFQSMGAGCFL